MLLSDTDTCSPTCFAHSRHNTKRWGKYFGDCYSFLSCSNFHLNNREPTIISEYRALIGAMGWYQVQLLIGNVSVGVLQSKGRQIPKVCHWSGWAEFIVLCMFIANYYVIRSHPIQLMPIFIAIRHLAKVNFQQTCLYFVSIGNLKFW